jgi:hypothetical protein
MSQPYLFYSERCANSKQIIETLKALNKTSLYKFILVESLQRNQIPSFLTKVPTLYNPETKEVVVGKDIYGYIAKPTNSRKELPAKQDGAVTQGPGAQAPMGDLTAWGFEGMGRLTESYSSWDTPTSFTNEGGSMFTFLGGPVAGGPGQSAPAGAEPSSQNTIKDKAGSNADVAARMKAMEAQRKTEFSGTERT